MSKDSIRKMERQGRLKAEIVTYKREHKCTDCKFNFPPICMEFDHLKEKGGRQNEVNILVRQGRMTAARQEILKCDLLCSNCHRIRTATRNGWNYLL